MWCTICCGNELVSTECTLLMYDLTWVLHTQRFSACLTAQQCPNTPPTLNTLSARPVLHPSSPFHYRSPLIKNCQPVCPRSSPPRFISSKRPDSMSAGGGSGLSNERTQVGVIGKPAAECAPATAGPNACSPANPRPPRLHLCCCRWWRLGHCLGHPRSPYGAQGPAVGA